MGRDAEPADSELRKILIVDDHPLIRAALRSLLDCRAPWEVVGEVATAREALALVSSESPDLVLMDVALPGMDGVIATREILRRAPRTRVLILSAHVHPWDVAQALSAGACGYALKSDTNVLMTALETVRRGERYLSPTVEAIVSAHKQETKPAAVMLASLSEREKEVFRLAAECLLTREIARELCISRKTVDTHLYRIYRKLGLRSSAELVRMAFNLGLSHGGRRREVSAGATPPSAPLDAPIAPGAA